MSTIVDKNDDEQKMSTIGAKNTEDLKMAPIGAKNTEDLKMAPIGAKNTEDEEATDSDFSDSDDSQPEMILPRNEAQARPLSWCSMITWVMLFGVFCPWSNLLLTLPIYWHKTKTDKLFSIV